MSQQNVALRRLCHNAALRSRREPQRGLYALKHIQPTLRGLHTTNEPKTVTAKSTRLAQNLEQYKKAFVFPRPSAPAKLLQVGAKVHLNGFLSRRRVIHSKLIFADLETGDIRGLLPSSDSHGPERSVQITSNCQDADTGDGQLHKMLKAMQLHSPVSVTGTVVDVTESRIELKLEGLQSLNEFPRDIIVSDGVIFPPTSRHLQIRFSDLIRTRLRMRNMAAYALEAELADRGFLQVETPLLFKSTPEGASEFLVPTRRKGMAYALPQSPQQYKQLLMASGVRNYFQFARCFRDEDLRADRQPEFTQLDMEMSFANAEDVMRTVEQLVKSVVTRLSQEVSFARENDEFVPILTNSTALQLKSNSEAIIHNWKDDTRNGGLFDGQPFPRLSYTDAMTRYGSDKPDLRIPFAIKRMEHFVPADFVQKISNVDNPIVEAIVFKQSQEPDMVAPTLKDIAAFMDSLPPAQLNNPDGGPAPVVFDRTKPLNGLSALGFEAADALQSMEGFEDLEDGDFLIFQARENKPFEGGSTALGRIRTALYEFAVQHKWLRKDSSFRFLWVNEFPMFTPDNETDPGQGGTTGFSATHHPFTAPFSQADFDLLATNPLAARGDSFDLVVNGIELGGGSRRIHLAQMQEDIMREVLGMSKERVKQFAHLIEALRAGCPPHAGFALGFDRLIAVLSYAESLRDVIAFPKSSKGEDMTVKSPAKLSRGQLEKYHIVVRQDT